MSDTLVTTDEKSGYRVFGKNSDRHPNEPQLLLCVEGTEGLDVPTHVEHRKAYDTVQYPRIQEASRSFRSPLKALISRPSWIWGAEMGVNEAGVAIGNEAVFARTGTQKDGLLGMDILRLALHNAESGEDAVTIIGRLLERYGQGGNGSYQGTLRHHNAFLITDARRAFVLESAGKQWIFQEIEDHHSISNSYTIARFATAHASRVHLLFTKGTSRQQRSLGMLETSSGSWDTIHHILTDNRGTDAKMDHSMHSICMDATGLVRSRTTASMIVTYPNGKPLIWATGAPLPNFSPYIPSPLDMQLPYADIGYAYRFAKERMSLTDQILVAPDKAKTRIIALARSIEQRCHTIMEEAIQTDDALVRENATITCLAEEQTYRNEVRDILIEFGAESPGLHEKPDSYHRCG